jgi:high affinity Mn2+ porin
MNIPASQRTGSARLRREGGFSAHRSVLVLTVSTLLLAHPPAVRAKNPEQPETAPRSEDMTFLDHERSSRFWLGAEVNSIFQYHPAFAAPYTGTNSLRPDAETALSSLLTVFLSYSPFSTTDLILDPEMALGGGLSRAVGAAGFPNLDVVRNPTLSHAPYIARLEIHQVIPLSQDWVANEDRGPISSQPLVPRHRLDLRLGKMSTADLFDINPVGSDSHLQFMNWTVDNNGSFDYAADTRGYTYGFLAEYQGPLIEVRFGEMLMPKVANGIDLDFDLSKSRGENLELEIKYSARSDRRGTVRLLGYQNHANMGSYQEAIDAVSGTSVAPDITLHRRAGRIKRGVGANAFQQCGAARFFARLGWSNGDYESFAYTEVENTVALGGDLAGGYWGRPADKVGLAFVSNGISSPHREYLRLGGLGFLLGDGNLAYSRETIVEQYYNAQVWRGMFLAEDIQVIANPGYNHDRGPVWVFSLRGHLEF